MSRGSKWRRRWRAAQAFAKKYKSRANRLTRQNAMLRKRLAPLETSSVATAIQDAAALQLHCDHLLAKVAQLEAGRRVLLTEQENIVDHACQRDDALELLASARSDLLAASSANARLQEQVYDLQNDLTNIYEGGALNE